MATFEARVEGLTGLSIGTSPTTAELTEYLNDGVVEVTSRIISLKPEEILQFTRVSGEVTSNGSEKVDRAKIISVIREADTNNDWRECRFIQPALQTRVTDINSLHYASTYNPAYTVLEDGAISVFPLPGSTTKAFKVYYVNNNPRNDSDDSLAYDSSGIAFFPKDRVYLVVLYAGIRTLMNKLSSIDIKGGITDELPSPPVLADNSVSFSETAPVFTPPSMSPPDWSDTNQWISTEEDPEMLQSRVAEINGKIQEFSARLQESTALFNDANTEYQANLQIAIQDAQLSSQDDSQKLQEYNAEIQSYQQSVSSQITQYRTDYDWMTRRLIKLQSDYDTAFLVMTGKISPQKASSQSSAPSQRKQRRRN